MADEGIFRRMRGAIGNGVVWGAAWSLLWVVVVMGRTLLGVTGILPALSWLEVLGGMIRFGIPFGILGFVAGGAFSGVISLLYRGRRLAEIRSLPFGIGGGVVAGLFVPVFMQVMNLLSGDGLVPWGAVLDDAVLTAVFGGVAAGASLKLAQRTEMLLAAGNRGDPVDQLASIEEHPYRPSRT